MKDALEDALARLRRVEGVDYADARLGRDEREALTVRDGELDRVVRQQSVGVGVRVLWRGAWGFAATPVAAGGEAAGADLAARRALEIARASAATNRERVRLAEEEAQRGSWSTPVVEDPFAVPVERKAADLLTPAERLRVKAHAKSVEAHTAFYRLTTTLATTEGTLVEQTLVHGSSGMKLIVERDGEIQQRSHPMDHDGQCASAGYEMVRALDHEGAVERLYDEALALLGAPPLPAGEATLILDPTQLALQIHESCGHPTEADRAMGDELSLAGASFLTPDLRGSLRYGAPIVNLAADATTPGGMGTFGWDDEGVPARRTPLVERGIFVGYLSSRETAAALGLPRSSGAMRAESWARVPIVRMVNVSLEPGEGTCEDLISDTDDGVLLACNKSWSIDHLRLNFQFGCEIAWEIKHGRRTRMFRNPVYGGRTPEFWGSCDRIAGAQAWRLHGFLHCGKGDPVQIMHVGHGCAPARFRGVRVGAASPANDPGGPPG